MMISGSYAAVCENKRKGRTVMDNIIDSILDIDSGATSRLKEAEDKKNRIIADARAEEEKIIGSCVEEAEKRLKALEDRERSDADKRVAEVRKNRDGEIAKLDGIYEKKHSEWESKLFSAVINGTY